MRLLVLGGTRFVGRAVVAEAVGRIPPGQPWRSLHETNTDKAFAAGLRCRPVEQTVADTWAWMRADGLA